MTWRRRPTAAPGVIPRLDGRNASCLEARLKDWRPRDPESTCSPVPAIADAPSDEARAALAERFAAREPRPGG